jgi:hypothetical protein
MMCGELLSVSSLRTFWHRALPILLLTLIPMGLSSQSSGPKSGNSNATSQTWEQLSGKFQKELTALRRDLQTALSDAKQSKTSLRRLTVLYETSLGRITDLETFNGQIGQRMQESDEWNAELQGDNIKLEADIQVAKAKGLRNTIIAGVGGLALGLLLPIAIKMARASKIIPL